MICDRKTVFFTELFKAAKSKYEVITIFLAILELIKIREIVVRQVAPFGDIELIRNTETINPSTSPGLSPGSAQG